MQHKKLIVRRLYFRFENCEEKIENNLHVTKICRYFAPALMKEILLKSKVLKKSFSKKNLSKRFGSCRKTPYLCTRFDEDNTSRMRKFLGRFDDEKNLSKRFGDLKNLPYLCTTFPLKTGTVHRGADKAGGGLKKEKVLYSNIGTVFFEVFEQLKFIHSSE